MLTVLKKKKEKEFKKGCAWQSLCGQILGNDGEKYVWDFVHNNAYGDENTIWQNTSTISLAQIVCNRVEQLVRECSREMMEVRLGVTVQRKQADDVRMIISSLCEAFPEAEPMGRAVIRELEKKYQKMEENNKTGGIQAPVQGDLNHMRRQRITIDYTNALRFLLQCNLTYRVANRQKGSEIVGAYYRSLINDFADQMKLTVSVGQMNQARAFLRKLKTVEEMLPYYFSARFILANAARYDELHLGQTEQTRGKATAAKVYQDILQAMTQQEYSVLQGFMVEIRAKYAAELRSSFEVTA